MDEQVIAPVYVEGVVVGAGVPVLIAGPCVIESEALCLQVASELKSICQRMGIPYIFKASFDKANRTSLHSFRGPGIEQGLRVLATVKRQVGVPVTTDIHEPWQAERAAEVVDLLQIPAFLCRQTDLLVAAARTGKPVNVKKGQFMAPWDMRHVVEKLRESGAAGVMLTERGVSFGYNTLVVDFTALPQMRALGVPVVFDATHSVQLPGGAGSRSGGRREFIPHLVRAAVAVGIDALFMEVHPEPDQGLSDPATMFPLRELEGLLTQVVAIHQAVSQG
jgi:2-dehydro-3-deoxyphosphooctonate aldolase (KDO 8-P synthase)